MVVLLMFVGLEIVIILILLLMKFNKDFIFFSWGLSLIMLLKFLDGVVFSLFEMFLVIFLIIFVLFDLSK